MFWWAANRKGQFTVRFARQSICGQPAPHLILLLLPALLLPPRCEHSPEAPLVSMPADTPREAAITRMISQRMARRACSTLRQPVRIMIIAAREAPITMSRVSATNRPKAAIVTPTAMKVCRKLQGGGGEEGEGGKVGRGGGEGAAGALAGQAGKAGQSSDAGKSRKVKQSLPSLYF